MRLHTLGVTAFGPFADTQRVDFDALSAAGLFLFTGATGAGKTSILDAVCFALYGQVPGARQQARDLRSDHAAQGARPEVVLEVTLRGRRLRITRSPAWERPKLRGTGTTLEQAKVLVEELCGDDWLARSTRLDEAGQLLSGLLGLTLAQFCQVALLPQGQFAEFLRADADRRRDLLESLFDTRRFAAVESWLVAARQQAARELAEADQELAVVLARVAEASGCEAPAELATDDATRWLDSLLQRARRAAEEASASATRASEVAARAARVVTEAERRDGLRRRREDLRQRLNVLAAQQAARDAAAAELEAARAVAPLLPLLTEAGRLAAELAEVRVLATNAHRTLAPMLTATATATGTDGDRLPPATLVRDASRTIRDRAVELRAVIADEQRADELAQAAEALQRQVVEAETRRAKADVWLRDAAERRTALAASRDAARAAADGCTAAATARDQGAARVEAARRRDELSAWLTTARDAERARTDDHQAARDAVQSLREARLAGMAAELAAGLRPEQVCPVCGSTQHPSPAPPAGDPVTREMERAAERRLAMAETARREATEAVSRIEADLAAARTAAGGDRPVDDLSAELAALVETSARQEALAAGREAAEAALEAFDQEHESWTREQVAQQAHAATLAARVAEQQAEVAELAAAVATARGDDPTVSAKVLRLDRLATDLDALARHLGDLERLDGAVADARARAEAGVRARRLPSVRVVEDAARDDARVAELEDLLRRHDTELAAVREQLADPDLVAAAAPAQDLAVLRSAAGEAASDRDQLLAGASQATARAEALSRLQIVLEATVAARRPLAARHRLVDSLSRLAEGKSADNRLRMSLSAYVLAARLEQVAECATHRLLRMSSGRYSLVHTAQGAGRGRGGLQLRVLDAWTGQQRDPATLSGGESFSASLALALGLADVVTAEAGGALLETLFVDEGFGTLDDDTLDDVMGVLDDLRDGGRTVGIVSHVADLRQRIPVQLRVEKGRNGSVVHQ